MRHGKINQTKKGPTSLRISFRRFFTGLTFDPRALTITILSTLALMVDAYFNITSIKVVDRTILYLAIPLLVIGLFFRQSPAQYGLQLGDWRAGLTLTLIAILLLAPVIWIVVRVSPGLQQYYQDTDLTTRWALFTILELVGWEFFFRGFIYFGYQKEFGDHALWLQAVPFALAHLGKPAAETLTTLFGGFLFALIARRTRSILYPFLIHLFVAVFTKWAALALP